MRSPSGSKAARNGSASPTVLRSSPHNSANTGVVALA
jgi:hypothetical protein